MVYTPIAGDGQTAVLIDRTIWVFGGQNEKAVDCNCLNSLDVSQSWPRAAPAWTNHSSDTNSSIAPQSSYHSMWVSEDERSFYVWGWAGNFVQYNVYNNFWSAPSATAGMPVWRYDLQASTYQGVAYLWAGYGDSYSGE